MSAASESAASPSPCACTNISLMQLFHELKQKFPGVPDHVVSNTIELYCHDKHACETHLHSEAKASLTHAYHASSSAAARQLNELKVDAPVRCRNQPIVKHEVPNATVVTATDCEVPQTAVISSLEKNEIENLLKPEFATDANQNVVETINHIKAQQISNIALDTSSPVTVINLDNCVAKYSADSPSDVKLINDKLNEGNHSRSQQSGSSAEQAESINYKINKSNKIKFNLHEKLEKGKEKKTISKKAEPPQSNPVVEEKPKRPCTLELSKPKPDIAFKQNLQEPERDQCRSISPISAAHKPEAQTHKETTPGGSYWVERGCPLNVSVNVNCHMDLGSGYPDPWLEDFNSPRAITSLNLTVCTPTSNMASPVRDVRDDDGGFESHFTVTVSPSTPRPTPRRRAPPPPPSAQPLEPQRTVRTPTTSEEPAADRSLIARQRERLGRLVEAVAVERARLCQLTRETGVLAAPADPAAALHLRALVDRLRHQCDVLAKKIDTNESGGFYSNIYTGQRPSAAPAPAPAPAAPPAWRCHMCTFRNHPLLDKCEECDMPRILVVRAADGITVRLVPGRRSKIVRSWVL